MALVIQQVQCSYTPLRPISWTGKIESKKFLAAFPKVGTYGILSNHTSLLCITLPPLIHVLKRKSLRMLSFKAGFQDNKEIMYDAQEFQNIESPVTVESNGTIAGSVAVQNLFKSWLTLLRMPSPHQPAEGMLEGPFLHNIVEAEDSVQDSGRGEILKIVWCNRLGLHSTIKITAIIFIPMYLAVSMKYGAEVVKELAPLWTGGPLIVAAYATMIQLISSLYIFSFRQSVKLLKKSPMV